MRWSLRCTNEGLPAAAARYGASSKRHKVTFKKSLRAAEQKRADVARARRRWIREQGTLDTTRLVFIDETAANTKMVRLSGRCLRGDWLVGHVPYGHWKTTSRMSSNVSCQPSSAMSSSSTTSLRTKFPCAREANEARGATLRYLPQYSRT
jgi:hypothetical protein